MSNNKSAPGEAYFAQPLNQLNCLKILECILGDQGKQFKECASKDLNF